MRALIVIYPIHYGRDERDQIFNNKNALHSTQHDYPSTIITQAYAYVMLMSHVL